MTLSQTVHKYSVFCIVVCLCNNIFAMPAKDATKMFVDLTNHAGKKCITFIAEPDSNMEAEVDMQTLLEIALTNQMVVSFIYDFTKLKVLTIIC